MPRPLRLALYASACLILAAPATAQPSAPPPALRDKVWAQSYSDLAPDPAIRFGTLANGLRYAIERNATPTHQVSLRLRIGSGSLEERDDEQGLAHVLEHMAFKGSAHAPGDTMKVLQRLGLAFGADTNASTGFTETVYQFDLPRNDADSIDTGLNLMRGIAGDLKLDPAALEPERGVVLSEERLRDTPDYEAMKAHMAFQLQGQLAAQRLPIGKVDIVRNAPASLIREFYRANYRPDRAVLIVIGDIDPAAIAREVAARFGDWSPMGPETPAPDLGRVAPRGPAVQLVVRRGVEPSIAIWWVKPVDETPDSVARERRDLIRNLALQALNRRYARLSHGTAPPFLGASAGHEDVYRSADATSVNVLFRPDGWRTALAAAIQTQRQALQYGFTADELAREVTEYRVSLRNAAAGAATRRTPALANELVRSVDEREVETSPAQDLALFEKLVDGLKPADLDVALKQAFDGSGPLVAMSTPDAPDGGEGALSAALREAETRPAPPPPELAALKWTHTRFGAPGQVAERREVKDLGVTFVRFANGVQLIVKPTAFAKDQIDVAVRFGHGLLDEAKSGPNPDWASSAYIGGGLDDLSYEDIQQVLADKTASVGFGVGDDAFDLSGTTRPRDLDTELQLLAAYLTAPGWRPEAFEHARDMAAVALAQLPSTPAGVQEMELERLEHSGDVRWGPPSLAEVKATTLGQLKALIEPARTRGGIEVEVVGDVTVDEAVRQVAATLGALPARAPDPVPPGADQVRFPAPTAEPVVRRHRGRPDQAEAYVSWPVPDMLSDTDRTRRINMAAQVLQLRLIDKVRVAEGATYSPAAGASESDVFPGYGKVYADVEIPPARIAGFYADVARIATDLRTSGVTADELARATRPRIETIQKAQQTNSYWLNMLHGADRDPRRLDLIRSSVPGYQHMTQADVAAAARAWLSDDKAWRFEITPAADGAK